MTSPDEMSDNYQSFYNSPSVLRFHLIIIDICQSGKYSVNNCHCHLYTINSRVAKGQAQNCSFSHRGHRQKQKKWKRSCNIQKSHETFGAFVPVLEKTLNFTNTVLEDDLVTAVYVCFTALYLKCTFQKEPLCPTEPAHLNDSCNKLKSDVLLPLKGLSFSYSQVNRN